jgi:5-methylcytosine-specific restriction protein A
MTKINIQKDKMFFVHLTNMKKYCGYEKDAFGGGRYVEEKGYGHELFNFKNDGGKFYGYTTPLCKVSLERISKNDINQDAFGKYLDNVLVIFTCEGQDGKRVIAGLYQNARVYADAVNDNRKSRFFDLTNDCVKYNLICDVENAILISPEDRRFPIHRSKTKNGGGHGQSNIWYASEINDAPIKQEVLEYVNGIIKEEILDERKYHLHYENKTYVTSTKQIVRSRDARDECIRLKKCKCNICEFDFEEKYGDLGKDYIEVHHITPIGKLSSAIGYEGTDPKKDLIPLCSNCHSMIHRKNPPYTPNEIKEKITNKLYS